MPLCWSSCYRLSFDERLLHRGPLAKQMCLLAQAGCECINLARASKCKQGCVPFLSIERPNLYHNQLCARYRWRRHDVLQNGLYITVKNVNYGVNRKKTPYTVVWRRPNDAVNYGAICKWRCTCTTLIKMAHKKLLTCDQGHRAMLYRVIGSWQREERGAKQPKCLQGLWNGGSHQKTRMD